MCLSVLLKSLKKVSNPKSTSLFSVPSALKRFNIKIFVILDSYFRFFYLVCLTFTVFNNKKLWEMIGDRSGYITRGAFILVAVVN